MRVLDAHFLDAVSPYRVQLPSRTIELPIVYRDVSAIAAFTTVPAGKAAEILPAGSGLHPALALPGRGVLVIVCFNYRDSSVGSYGEVALGILCAPRRLPPLLPVLLDQHLPGLGVYVWHLPVTTDIALEAGRTLWNYPKFLADIRFDGPRCELGEGGRKILTLDVRAGGRMRVDEQVFRSYTVRDGKLLRTVIRSQMEYRLGRGRHAGRLELGEHPIGRAVAALEPSPLLLEARDIVHMQSILPAADWVRPLRLVA
jgi:acetoacetate decarboxylase